MAPRRHFSDQMFNPYFQSDHYKNESHEIKLQNKIENFFKKILIIKRKK
jgi:hypothetical protein